jgi:carbon-monoxide dehydrogenase large subunit
MTKADAPGGRDGLEIHHRQIGRSIQRIEDAPLVTGAGRFVDDIKVPGLLSVAFVRSPYAHARISAIDTEAARSMPGIEAVLVMQDLRARLTGDVVAGGMPTAAIRHEIYRPVLAAHEVVYAGEAVAMVIAATRAQAEDAAEAVLVDFDPLPAVADCRTALDEGAPKVHDHLPDNLLAEFDFDYGDADAAFRAPAHVVRGTFDVHRGGSHSMEGRGLLALPDQIDGRLKVWSSTQTPHALKNMLCAMLARSEEEVVVSVPDIGGGFGPKLVTYPEEIAVAAAALVLDRPLKWIEDRREHFLACTQERDEVWHMEMALDAQGRIEGLRGRMVHDFGAYTARGLNVPYSSGMMMTLPYNIPNYHLDIAVALTNKAPSTALRGAGQPQGAFVMERILDMAADKIGIDRAEIRYRNLVRPEQMPCTKPLKLRGGTNVILDSGDYHETQRSALEAAGWQNFTARKEAARAEGRSIGIGLANYLEGTGRGPYETVTVKVSRSGRVVVTTGATAMGQGLVTAMTQIVAEHLGGDLANIVIHTGDTTEPYGFGGFNSRQTVMAGASADAAARAIRSKVLAIAAHLLELDIERLDIEGDLVIERAGGNRSLTLREIALASEGVAGFQLPGIETPGLKATERVVIDDMTYTNGCAVAEVEVDRDTGCVRVTNLIFAHDCGVMVNPAMVEGQLLGGIAMGLGNSLFEKMAFDEEAQPLTTTYADYHLVTSAEMPPVTFTHTESPTFLNSLGVKGVGESGVIPMSAAIMSAVDDALDDLGLRMTRAPLSPQDLRHHIREASGEGAIS